MCGVTFFCLRETNVKKFYFICFFLLFYFLFTLSVSAENINAPGSTRTLTSPESVANSTSPQIDYEEIKTLKGYQGDILSIAFSPDGKLLVGGTTEQSIVIWDVANWQIIKTLVEDDDDVRALAFSRNGKYLASGYKHNKVHVWDTSTWKKICSINTSKPVNSLSFNGDSNVLAIARDDDTILLWDIKKDKTHNELKGHTNDVKAIAYSPDGLRLASGSRDNSAIIWDAISGDKIKVLNGHANNVEAISYSPDGKYLVTGSNDNSIVIWDAKTGNYIDTLLGHTERICTLSFVPHSDILVSGDCIIRKGPFGIQIRHSGSECKVNFWNIQALKPIESADFDCGSSCAAFSPDGKYFVIGHAVGGRFITIYKLVY